MSSFDNSAFDDGSFDSDAFDLVDPDNVSPEIALTSLIVGSVCTFTATASDNVGVTGVVFFLDGSPAADELLTAPYQWDWDFSGQLDGDYYITAEARDAAGNIGVSNTLQIIVANGADVQGAPVASGSRHSWQCIAGEWQQIQSN